MKNYIINSEDKLRDKPFIILHVIISFLRAMALLKRYVDVLLASLKIMQLLYQRFKLNELTVEHLKLAL